MEAVLGLFIFAVIWGELVEHSWSTIAGIHRIEDRCWAIREVAENFPVGCLIPVFSDVLVMGVWDRSIACNFP